MRWMTKQAATPFRPCHESAIQTLGRFQLDALERVGLGVGDDKVRRAGEVQRRRAAV